MPPLKGEVSPALAPVTEGFGVAIRSPVLHSPGKNQREGPQYTLRCPKNAAHVRLLAFFDRYGKTVLASSTTGGASTVFSLSIQLGRFLGGEENEIFPS